MQNARPSALATERRSSEQLSALRAAKVTWGELGCPTKIGDYMDAKYRVIRVAETHIAEAGGDARAVFWLFASEPMSGPLSYRLGSRIGAELTESEKLM